MTGQQYTVIADRTKGEAMWPPREGDRVTYGRDGWGKLVAVRIERPVPTTELQETSESVHPVAEIAIPHLPTRKQIADEVKRVTHAWSGPSMGAFINDPPTPRQRAIADAIFALIQNGAER